MQSRWLKNADELPTSVVCGNDMRTFQYSPRMLWPGSIRQADDARFRRWWKDPPNLFHIMLVRRARREDPVRLRRWRRWHRLHRRQCAHDPAGIEVSGAAGSGQRMVGNGSSLASGQEEESTSVLCWRMRILRGRRAGARRGAIAVSHGFADDGVSAHGLVVHSGWPSRMRVVPSRMLVITKWTATLRAADQSAFLWSSSRPAPLFGARTDPFFDDGTTDNRHWIAVMG